MKILYVGGQKSGKSRLASSKAVEIATKKPFYVATYDNSFNDASMQNRIENHIKEREDMFETIEEAYHLQKIIKPHETYVIDCISMWLFNNLSQSEEELKQQLKEVCEQEANIIFVLNNVNSGVIPFDSESRRFVDMSGIIGQFLAQLCDEVIEVRYGLEVKLK